MAQCQLQIVNTWILFRFISSFAQARNSESEYASCCGIWFSFILNYGWKIRSTSLVCYWNWAKIYEIRPLAKKCYQSWSNANWNSNIHDHAWTGWNRFGTGICLDPWLKLWTCVWYQWLHIECLVRTKLLIPPVFAVHSMRVCSVPSHPKNELEISPKLCSLILFTFKKKSYGFWCKKYTWYWHHQWNQYK